MLKQILSPSITIERMCTFSDGVSGKVCGVLKDEAMQYSFSHYVWSGSVLVLGGFVGYVLGFVSHARKRIISGRGWTSLKSEET